MKILIAEGNEESRDFLYQYLSFYGQCDMTFDGEETVDAFTMSIDSEETYSLVCLSVKMPAIDGIEILKTIRQLEKQNNIAQRAKFILTTELREATQLFQVFSNKDVTYLTVPISKLEFLDVLIKMDLK